jgi:hypothetical protein
MDANGELKGGGMEDGGSAMKMGMRMTMKMMIRRILSLPKRTGLSILRGPE